MSSFTFVFEAAADRALAAACWLDVHSLRQDDHLRLQDEVERAVHASISTVLPNALALDIQGAAAFVAQTADGQRSIVFTLKKVTDGLEVTIASLVDSPAENNPQILRHARRC